MCLLHRCCGFVHQSIVGTRFLCWRSDVFTLLGAYFCSFIPYQLVENISFINSFLINSVWSQISFYGEMSRKNNLPILRHQTKDHRDCLLNSFLPRIHSNDFYWFDIYSLESDHAYNIRWKFYTLWCLFYSRFSWQCIELLNNLAGIMSYRRINSFLEGSPNFVTHALVEELGHLPRRKTKLGVYFYTTSWWTEFLILVWDFISEIFTGHRLMSAECWRYALQQTSKSENGFLCFVFKKLDEEIFNKYCTIKTR